MTNFHSVVQILTIDGLPFIAYAGHQGTVFLERLRRDGRRDHGSMFQFDPNHLIAALHQIGAVAEEPAYTGPMSVAVPAASD